METLVLSASWTPHARIRWKRALRLLIKGKAEIVEEYQDRYITFEIKMPSVIRLLKVITRTTRAVRFSKENIYMRDKGKCQYCGKKVPRDAFTYDHVHPRSLGGKTNWENIVVCCMPCNQKKGSRSPAQANMRLLSTPAKPKKLAETLQITLTWKPGMPDPWRTWLRDIKYWYGELEEET